MSHPITTQDIDNLYPEDGITYYPNEDAVIFSNITAQMKVIEEGLYGKKKV